MNNEIATIAQQATDTLSPYLGPLLDQVISSSEQALKKIVGNNVHALWQKLGVMITGNPKAKAAAEKLANNPQDVQAQEQLTTEMTAILTLMQNLIPEVKEILAQAGDISGNTVTARNSAVAIGPNSAAANNHSAVVQGDVHGNITIGK